MPMKNPPHPGLGLRNELEELGWPISEAADALGITRSRLQKVVTGKGPITPDMAIRLEKGIGSTADAWLRMQAAYDLTQVRLRRDEIRVKKLASKRT